MLYSATNWKSCKSCVSLNLSVKVFYPIVKISATDPVPRIDFPANTVLLDTRMRHGVISYKTKHILKREKNWQPSNKHVSDLLELHNETPDARVQFISKGNGGIHYKVIPATSCCPCW